MKSKPTIRGDRIRALRIERGLEQGQLAYRAQVDTSYVYRLEAGENPNVSAAILSRIAGVLRTSTDFLVGTTDVPTPVEPADVNWPADVVAVAERLGELPDATRGRVTAALEQWLDVIEAEIYAGLSEKKRQIVDYFDDLDEADQEVVLRQVLELLRRAGGDAPSGAQSATK